MLNRSVLIKNKALNPWCGHVINLYCTGTRNKFPLTKAVSVISLVWLHVSTTKDHLQPNGIKYINEIPFMYFYVHTVHID